MRRNTISLTIVLSSLLMLNGCLGRAISESVGAFRGASGTYVPIRPLSADKDARPLGEYTKFELGEFTNTIGANAPAELWSYLPSFFEQQILEHKLPNRPGKTLILRGTILHYESAGMVGQVTGPIEEVVARVDMVDKDSGSVLAEATVVGRTTQTVNQGVEKKAAGLAKGLVSWIDKRYPKEGREE